jgi:hypothetical protein
VDELSGMLIVPPGLKFSADEASEQGGAPIKGKVCQDMLLTVEQGRKLAVAPWNQRLSREDPVATFRPTIRIHSTVQMSEDPHAAQ